MSKIGLALLGQALPDASALRGHVSSARCALIYSVIAACMISAIIIAGLYGGYVMLIAEGLSNVGSIIVVSLVAVFLVMFTLQRAAHHGNAIADITDDLKPLHSSDAADSLIELALTSFVEGATTVDDVQDKATSEGDRISLVKE